MLELGFMLDPVQKRAGIDMQRHLIRRWQRGSLETEPAGEAAHLDQRLHRTGSMEKLIYHEKCSKHARINIDSAICRKMFRFGDQLRAQQQCPAEHERHVRRVFYRWIGTQDVNVTAQPAE